MFVLLREVETNDKYYLYMENFNVEIERTLIELYYRDLISGLIDYSSEYAIDDVEIYQIKDWLGGIDLSKASNKSLEAFERLNKIV